MTDRELDKYRRQRREDIERTLWRVTCVCLVILVVIFTGWLVWWHTQCRVEHAHVSPVKARIVDANGNYILQLEDGSEHRTFTSVGSQVRVGDLFTYAHVHDRCKGEAP